MKKFYVFQIACEAEYDSSEAEIEAWDKSVYANAELYNDLSISRDGVTVVYDRAFNQEVAEFYVSAISTCVPFMEERLMIGLPEPARTQFHCYLSLISDGSRPHASAGSKGIYISMTMESHDAALENLDSRMARVENGECLLTHEMTHVFVARTPIPTWANEGLATYAEKEFDDNHSAVECRENGWYGLDYFGEVTEHPYSDLSEPKTQNGDPGIYWYYTAYCFWVFIRDNYGEGAIMLILQKLKANEDNFDVDFLRDIVNEAVGEDVTPMTGCRFGVPTE
jgi:hypothetical protein